MAEWAQPPGVIMTSPTGTDLYPLRPSVPLARPEAIEKNRVALAPRQLTRLASGRPDAAGRPARSG